MNLSNLVPSSAERYGSGLKRPECVLCFASGDVIGSQLGSGIFHLSPEGRQRLIGQVETVDGTPFIPNGLAFWSGHGVVIANMGEAGGLWRLDSAGIVTEVLRAVDDIAMRATNFVLVDARERLWFTVTTQHWPIFKAFTALGQPNIADGFIGVLDEKGPRIVADSLAFANELRIDEAAQQLYVAETFGRRISRFAIAADASLSGRETFAQFGQGVFPDGLAFDVENGLWATSLISNQLLRISPDGAVSVMLADSDPQHIAAVEAGLAENTLGRDDFLKPSGKILSNISSLAFGGPDLRTIYLGSLSAGSLFSLRSPVAGKPMAHWQSALSF
jgi:sugar lactone lactonase YvrE